jgi:hypothetical protein
LLFAPILALVSLCFFDIRVHIVATRAAVRAAPAVFPVAHQVAFRIVTLCMLPEDVPAFVHERARSGAIGVIAAVCRAVVAVVLAHEEMAVLPGARTFDGWGITGCKCGFPVFRLAQEFSFLCVMERANAVVTAHRLPTRSDAIQIHMR